jgi:AraC family transcriptional regulator
LSYHVVVFIGTPLYSRECGSVALGSWIAAPAGGREHTHLAAHFMFIKAGAFLTGSRCARARAPLIFNPAGTTHRDRFESGGRFFSIAFADALEDAPASPREIDRVTSHTVVARLMRECESWDADSPEIAEALCAELLTSISEHEPDRQEPKWLAKAAEVLMAGTRVSLVQLSRELGVHRTHLTRTFRQFHGCTPAEFARFARLRRAAAALASTNVPLSDIALDAGFADQSHFTKHFRAAYGVPPGEYRRLSS